MAEEEKGFIIKDRRTFSQETGEPVERKTEESPRGKERVKGPAKPRTESDTDEEIPLPEVNFSTFVFSISSSALLNFGEIPDPTTGKKNRDLRMAKHSIDILSMLEEKTRGNRNEDEEQLIKNILYDLRMRYVKETK